MSAPIVQWVAEPPPNDVQGALARLAQADGVVRVAAMPDVHLAREVCVGTVVATQGWLYPAALGGDVGCGLTAARTALRASALKVRSDAVLAGLQRMVPILTRPPSSRCSAADLPSGSLSDPRLSRLASRDGVRQLGTLGRGNHFLELQAGEDDAVWIVVHSGSRSLGPAIQAHHRARAEHRSRALDALKVGSEQATDWLNDVAWARRYAERNREEVVLAAAVVLGHVLGTAPPEHLVVCDHNHVEAAGDLWIHRKGALSARPGEHAIIPGSMGASTYRVVGRGCAEALWSSSHGAGRCMSRTEARRRLTGRDVLAQTRGVVIDRRHAGRMTEEAPAAYRPIDAVMRAQRQLTRIVERMRPLLNHRGGAL